MITLRLETPSIFISPEMAERAHDAGIAGMTINQPDLAAVVHVASGRVKPAVGALVVRGRREWRRNPDLLQLPQTGVLENAPTVELEAVTEAARAESVNYLHLRPGALTLEGLRRATYIAANKWHDAPGAWDQNLWICAFSGGGLGLAADILYNSTPYGDFGNLTNNAVAAAAGALFGGVVITPIYRHIKYRYDSRSQSGIHPIRLQYSDASSR